MEAGLTIKSFKNMRNCEIATFRVDNVTFKINGVMFIQNQYGTITVWFFLLDLLERRTACIYHRAKFTVQH